MSQNASDEEPPRRPGSDRRESSEPPEDGIDRRKRADRRVGDRRSTPDRRAGSSEPMEIADYLQTAEQLRVLAQELVAQSPLSPEPEAPTEPSELPSTQGDVETDPEPSGGPEEPSTAKALPHSDTALRAIVARMVDDILKVVETRRRQREEQLEEQQRRRQSRVFAGARITRREIVVAVAAVAVLIAGQLVWSFWPRTADIPDGMVGLWTTITPRYADRAFRVTKNTVTFHVSAQDSTFHDIVRVLIKDDTHATRYTIFYTSFGVEYEFPLFYSESPDTTIQLLHQREMTWRKELTVGR